MQIEFEGLDRLLLGLAASSPEFVLLVAPFAKRSVVEAIVSEIDASMTTIELITRWRPDEIAGGVSDVDVYEVITDFGGSVYLLNDLHAKYYRFDQMCLLGSANLTRSGLGISPDSNLEVLFKIDSDCRSVEFEAELYARSTRVDDATFDAFMELQNLLRRGSKGESKKSSFQVMLNLSRHPAELWDVYLSGVTTQSGLENSKEQRFFEAIGIPAGITSEETFDQIIKMALQSNSVVRHLNVSLIEQPQRFGALSDLLAKKLELDRQEVKPLTQALIRNLIYFVPNLYQLSRPRFSEILHYRGDLSRG